MRAGTGVETRAGARYTLGALTIEGQVRTLVAHGESAYEEWGASGSIALAWHPKMPRRRARSMESQIAYVTRDRGRRSIRA